MLRRIRRKQEIKESEKSIDEPQSNKQKKKSKFDKIIFIILVVVFILMLSAIIFINAMRAIDGKYRNKLLNEYKNSLKVGYNASHGKKQKSINNDNAIDDFLYGSKKYKEQTVVGELIIDKINVDYPILDNDREDTLMISVGVTTGRVNITGNLVIAGHNMKNKTMFGNLDKLQIGDCFTVISEREKVKYKIFRRVVVDPMDFSILRQDTGGDRWVTLFTCTNGGKQRLAFQAAEIK